ncbi:hypothetical protein [Halorubrum sp. FL23]|uniref:hypothetical protein n=1 Tax=Halorubrum sp. FL23 TaxID=3458704 RepID=UPI004033BBC7
MRQPLQELKIAAAQENTFEATSYKKQLIPKIYRENISGLKYLRAKEMGMIYVFYQGLEGLLHTIDDKNGTIDNFSSGKSKSTVRIEDPSFLDEDAEIKNIDDLVEVHQRALHQINQYPDTLYGQIPEDLPSVFSID